MAFRNILTWPNPALKKKSEVITSFDEDLTALAHDLYDTMNVVTGVGLAAPQVGTHQRLVIVDMSQCDMDNPFSTEGFPENILVMANPSLELSGPKHKWMEACLSVPDSKGLVERHQFAKVTFNTVSGEEKSLELDWPASGVFQHECDHLEGILYVDRMNRMSRDMLLKRIKKKRKRMAEMRKMMLREEQEELDRIEGKQPRSSKMKATHPTKKRKKRPAKKNHLNKKRRKKK